MTVHTVSRDSLALVIEDNDFLIADMGTDEIKLLIMRMFEENGVVTDGETEIEIEVFPGKSALMVFAGLRSLPGHCEIYIFNTLEDIIAALKDLDESCFVYSRLVLFESRYYLFIMGERDEVTRTGLRLSEFAGRADSELKTFLLEHSEQIIGSGAIETIWRWFS